jgi:tripartite-type tricarboxylate transporter receptor subunit TctC
MNDLIAGTLDLLFDSVLTGLPQARDGRVRALAVTSRQPSPLAPGVPSVAELHAVPAEPEISQRLARLEAEPTGATPQALEQRMRSDTARRRRVAMLRGITTE